MSAAPPAAPAPSVEAIVQESGAALQEMDNLLASMISNSEALLSRPGAGGTAVASAGPSGAAGRYAASREMSIQDVAHNAGEVDQLVNAVVDRFA